MLTPKNTVDMLALKRRIEKLTLGDQLRLCAELIERGDESSLAIAETLGGNVVDAVRTGRMALGGLQGRKL